MCPAGDRNFPWLWVIVTGSASVFSSSFSSGRDIKSACMIPGDFDDISDYFLRKEQEKSGREKSENEARIPEKGSEDLITPEEFFLKNVDKYPPHGAKDEGPRQEAGMSGRGRKRRNSEKPEAIIDLHHRTTGEALVLLEKFLVAGVSRRLSTVLIISGKGIHSEEGKPVLREMILRWLNGDGRRFVGSYRVPPANLGGDGAILATLRKKKR